ncbi:MAG: PAS domain S-box protein [Bacteroidales bacterium]|nr:PAS domain S-box protein [Bacteroidales bacterium]
MFNNTINKINTLLKKSYNFYAVYSAISFVIIMVIALTIGMIGRNRHINETKQEMERASVTAAERVTMSIEQYAAKIKKITTWFNQIGNPELNFNLTRDQAAVVLSENIAEEPDMKSLFTVWEPQLFDGKDSLFIMKEYHDSTGRFIPIFTKNSEGIVERDYVKNYNDKDDINSYYYYKTRNDITFGQTRLTRENAKNLLLMSVTSPLKFGTRLLGVIGAEFNINSITSDLAELDIPKQFGITVITPDGQIIAAPEKKLLIGRSFTNIFTENSDYYYLKFRRNEDFETEQNNEFIIGRNNKIDDYGFNFCVCTIANHSAITGSGNIFLAKAALLGVAVFVLLLLLIAIFRSQYTMQIDQLTQKSKHITDVDQQYEEKSGLYIPELKLLDNIMKRLHSTFTKIKDLNREIETHSYNDTLDTLPKDNKFQQSYNKMLETLRMIASSENERKENETRQNWIKQGIALINESMRIGTNKVDLLCDNILLTLIKYADAVLGGIYIHLTEEDGRYLQLVSAVALGKKKALKIKIQKGVGLVGTCALEKHTIYLNNLPDDYITVMSGLGKSKPKYLAIIPLLYDDELIAVAEIAFIHELKDYEKKFLETMADTVASALVTARINAKTEQLMQQFRTQADTLAKNEKLMSENIKELKAEQQKSLEREADMKGLIDAVNNTILTIEYTTEGVLLSANEKYLKTMHYNLSEIQGSNVLDLVKTEREELEKVIKNVSTTGHYYEKEMKRFTKSGEVRWLWSTYTPYYNYEGKITKILYFAIDITENKKHQEELENKIKELEKQLKAVNETKNNNQHITDNNNNKDTNDKK